MTCLKGLELSNDCFDPVGWSVHNVEWCKRFGTRYLSVTVSTNALLGFCKVFVFPVIAVISAVVMPIIAAVRYWNGDHDKAKQWLAAWAFSLLAIAGAAAFLVVSGFHMRLLQGAALVATGCAISIVIHVYRVIPVRMPQITQS